MNSLRHLKTAFIVNAVLAAAIPMNEAYAGGGGQQLIGNQIPTHIFLNKSCMGTLIAPKIIVTAARCLKPDTPPAAWSDKYGPYVKFYRARDGKAFGGRYEKFTENPLMSVGDIAVVFLTEDASMPGEKPSNILPEYSIDNIALAEPSQRSSMSGYSYMDPVDVRRNLPLAAYTRDFFNRELTEATFDAQGLITVRRATSYYLTSACTRLRCADTDPMVYRNFRSVLADSPGIIYPDNTAPTLGKQGEVRRLLSDYKFTPEDVDDMIIATPLNAQKPGSVPPFQPGDQGAGIFGVSADGREVLVGLASTNTAQVRLSHYWPWIMKMAYGQRRSGDGLMLSEGPVNWETNVADTIAMRVLDAVAPSDTWGGTALYQANCVKGGTFIYQGPVATNINAKVARSLPLVDIGDGKTRCKGNFFTYNGIAPSVLEFMAGFPDRETAKWKLREWYIDAALTSPALGEIYSNLGGYYRLKKILAPKVNGYSLADMPINKSNEYWEYLGTQLPASRAMKYQFELPVIAASSASKPTVATPATTSSASCK